MEDFILRDKCNDIIKHFKEQFMENKQCIAAYLLGSMSHDSIWKWSDIQFVVVFGDEYRGKKFFQLLEDDMFVTVSVYTLSDFKKFIQGQDMDNYLWKAFRKSTKLFSRDIMLDDLLEESYFVGDAIKQQEMLVGFTEAIYYLDKVEYNLYELNSHDNVMFYLPQLIERIAWMVIIDKKQIPERELIPQAKKLNTELFEKIYNPLCYEKVDYEVQKRVVEECVNFLKSETEQVYAPVINHLKKYGDLEKFKFIARSKTYELNYDWLVRVGIAERYGKIADNSLLLMDQVYESAYQLKQ